MEEGEAPETGVLREAREETCATTWRSSAFWAASGATWPTSGGTSIHERYFFHLRCTGEPPVTWRHGEFSRRKETRR